MVFDRLFPFLIRDRVVLLGIGMGWKPMPRNHAPCSLGDEAESPAEIARNRFNTAAPVSESLVFLYSIEDCLKPRRVLLVCWRSRGKPCTVGVGHAVPDGIKAGRSTRCRQA